MTEQEAIEIHIAENIRRIEVIEDFMHTNYNHDDAVCGKNILVLSKINGLLQMVQQYRAIGTVEECRAAVEKQKEMIAYCDENDCADCLFYNASKKYNKCMNDFIAEEIEKGGVVNE